MAYDRPKPPKPEPGLPPCPSCGGEERYRLGTLYARCLACGRTHRDLNPSEPT